jgi:ribosome biogenesis GTPase
MAKQKDPLHKEVIKEKIYRQNFEREARRKQIKSARKNIKRDYQPKQARHKHWLDQTGADWDELDYEQSERVMPRDEGERRRNLERAAFNGSQRSVGEAVTGDSPLPGPTGLVIEVSKGLCQVDLGDRILVCRIRGALKAAESGFTNAVAVGDEVVVRETGSGSGVVETVLPRRSILVRPDVFYSHLQQVIVANADQLLIVSSWREPAIWLELIDRYLIAAERNHLPATICVNKIDLAEDRAACEAALQPYRELGYSVILTSAVSGEGVAQLQAALQNRLSVLAGLSGVGKSSLLAAAQPGLQLRTRNVSEHSGEGRHTTTLATLIRLEAGGAVVDTPGIREFGLSGLHRPELAHYFPEIMALAPGCRFADCTHLNEPDCAVRQAETSGVIAASRYHSYKQIYGSLPA